MMHVDTKARLELLQVCIVYEVKSQNFLSVSCAVFCPTIFYLNIFTQHLTLTSL